MEHLILLLMAPIIRRIENGSTKGAFVGALLAVLAGIVIAHALTQASWFDRMFRYAVYIAIPIPLALIGATIGASVGPARQRESRPRGLRLTNYNIAAAPLFVTIVLLAGVITLLVMLNNGKLHERGETPMGYAMSVGIMVGLTFAFFLVAAACSFRAVWSVEIGSNICVNRLLTSQLYQLRDIQLWGFVDTRKRGIIQQPFTGATQ